MMIARWLGRTTTAACACAIGLCCTSIAHAKLDVVVPAYFYPGALWTQLNTAASQVPLTAIMNPGNGPGGASDANYVSAVNSLRAAGGKVIGYVYSSYGSRPLAQVTADIDRYASWYNVDGIFVDEMANTGPAERLNYYKSIYDHVKNINSNWQVVGNPGTATIEQYLTWPSADRLTVFENVGSAYAGYTPSAWNSSYADDHFVHLLHTEPSSTNMKADLNLAVTRSVGGVFITNDVLNNPWDTLPSYWSDEISAIAQINAALLPADFNDNGAVNAADLTRWSQGFGDAAAAKFDGDANGDGQVDGSDLLVWQRQVGQSSLAAGVPTASQSARGVPEPDLLVLAGAAFLTIGLRTRAHTSGRSR
jgi:hypothetical protein